MINHTQKSDDEIEESSSFQPISLIDNEEEEQVEERTSQEEEEVEDKSFRSLLKKHSKSELKEIFYLSWPIVISNVMTALLGLVDMAFVGHLGKEYLAAAALGNAYFMCFGFAPATLSSAQDVLVSQADGMKNEHAKRIVLYRSFFIVTIAAMPVLCLSFFSDKLFILIGQDQTIANLTGRFVRFSAIGLYPYCISSILTRYLNAQSCVLFPMITTVLANIVNAILNTLLIRGIGYKGLGFDGAPIATSLTRIFIMFILILFTIRFESQKRKKNTEETTEESHKTLKSNIIHSFYEVVQLRGIIEYLKLGVPGLFQVMLEVWGFEATTLFAGLIPGAVYIAAHSVSLNIIVITFMIPMSVAIASAIRIGQCLGAKEASRAKVVSFLSVIVGVAFMFLNGFQLIAFRKLYGKLFTSDPDVVSLVASIIPICAVFQIVDGAQVTLNGILYGTGKLMVSAIAKFMSFYILGLPIGLLLGFYFKWKLQGLWIGLAIGLLSVSILLVFYVVFRIDFDAEVIRAFERVSKSDTAIVDPEITESDEFIQSPNDNDDDKELLDHEASNTV
jgi:MATE family multidrug resistance protein